MLICYIPILLCSLIQMVCIDNKPGISGARWSPARKLPLVLVFFFGRRLLLFPFASLGWGETERWPGGFVSLISCPSTLLLPYTLEASTNAVMPLNCSPLPAMKLETIRSYANKGPENLKWEEHCPVTMSSAVVVNSSWFLILKNNVTSLKYC